MVNFERNRMCQMNMTNETNYHVVLNEMCSINYKHSSPSDWSFTNSSGTHLRYLTVTFRLHRSNGRIPGKHVTGNNGILRYCSDICLEELRKPTKHLRVQHFKYVYTDIKMCCLLNVVTWLAAERKTFCEANWMPGLHRLTATKFLFRTTWCYHGFTAQHVVDFTAAMWLDALTAAILCTDGKSAALLISLCTEFSRQHRLEAYLLQLIPFLWSLGISQSEERCVSWWGVWDGLTVFVCF
jgi:hypothetical protein